MTEPVCIAIDAMGGDNAPKVIIEGVRMVDPSLNVEIILSGSPEAISAFGELPPNCRIEPASEVVEMKESPSIALKKKKNSSIAVAVDMVKQGKASGLISAGNSGACMAFAFFGLGRLKGISRPAIATLMPSHPTPTILLDVGANVDCKPEHLFHFGIMGKAYAENVLGIDNPKVGILSIGEEDEKGNELTHESAKFFRNSGLNFIGNIEGRDIFNGRVNVAVCDGFVGNILLKFGEGMAEEIVRTIEHEVTNFMHHAEIGNGDKATLKKLMSRMDYAEYGGAPLLGVNGNCIISHGRSSPKAIASAVKMAAMASCHDVNTSILEELGKVNTVNNAE